MTKKTGGCHVCHEDHDSNHYFNICLPEYRAMQAAETPKSKLQKRIDELAQYEDYGLSDDEATSLKSLRRELFELELDEKRPAEMSIARLDEYESEKRCIRRHLMTIARQIAEFRGEPFKTDDRFESYDRFETGDWGGGYGNKDWPKGTRLIKITIRRPCRYEPDYLSITFPESYLDGGWEAEEQKIKDAADAKKAAEEEQKRIEREAYERQKEERERAQLAELKARYPD